MPRGAARRKRSTGRRAAFWQAPFCTDGRGTVDTFDVVKATRRVQIRRLWRSARRHGVRSEADAGPGAVVSAVLLTSGGVGMYE